MSSFGAQLISIQRAWYHSAFSHLNGAAVQVSLFSSHLALHSFNGHLLPLKIPALRRRDGRFMKKGVWPIQYVDRGKTKHGIGLWIQRRDYMLGSVKR